jgi:hypothetical protein
LQPGDPRLPEVVCGVRAEGSGEGIAEERVHGVGRYDRDEEDNEPPSVR